MEIRNLFFNTPVRRKFMRTPQTEMGHIVEAFTRLALANPQIHMTLRSGSRELYDLAPTTRWAERIAAFFGGEVSDSLIAVDSDDGQIRIRGYVCDPSVSRGNTRMQYLILNGRHIRDRSLQHALSEAYRGLLMTGRNPICFLKLEIPPEMVDVNVHPTKLEVRFADSGRIYARVLQTLRQKFLTSDLTMRVGPSQPASGAQAGFADGSASGLPTSGTGIGGTGIGGPNQGQQPATLTAIENELGLQAAADDPYRQSVIEWARGTPSPTTTQGLAGQGLAGNGVGGESTAGNNLGSNHLGSERHGLPAFRPFGSGPLPAGVTGPAGSAESAPAGTNAASGDSTSETFAAAGATDGAADGASVDPMQVGRQDRAHAPGHYHLGYQVHNRYLVTQDEGGMVVVDQHALHERILYERIREKVLGGTLETQRLLVPEPVSLTPAEREAAIEAADMMAKVGIEIEAFGGDSVLVRTYPAMLSNLPPAEMLRQALDTLLTAGKDPDIRDLLDHLLHSIACKAAIKAGDRLTPEEITSLLEQRDLYHDTHHCPHGRPTALFFSRDELDRMFGRLGPRGKV
jgi:DNA mismatch repair protein MutL